MTFQDEQKQNEYSTFSAYYAEVAKRPLTAASRSLLNQLRTIAIGQFGNGAFQEIVRANRPAATEATTERTLGKQPGGVTRRTSSPEVKRPQPGTARHERLKERGLLPVAESKSAVAGVVAEGKPISKADLEEERQLAEQGMNDYAKGLQSEDLDTDAPNLSAKDLVEKYGSDAIAARLVELGEDAERLAEKTDRQLANLLKKKLSE